MDSPQRDEIGTAGLSAEEAARRLREFGANDLPSAAPKRWWHTAREVASEPMLFLLLVAGGIYFFLGEPLDGAILMSFVVVVMGITLVQERRTERAIEALRDMSSPRALVVRDGIQRRIPGREVVAGDLVVLAEGDRVPADGVMVESRSLSVDESLLTGESVPVRKTSAVAEIEMGAPGGDGTPHIFSGTLVVSGQGMCVVKAIGADTEMGRIGSALSGVGPERTGLQKEVDRWVRALLIVGLVLCSAVALVYGLTRADWLGGVLSGITLAMAILPEEFPVVLTVFLALGAWRLSRFHVLVRRMPVVETLGSTTVLCVDKTGTITANRMSVADLVVDGEVLEVGACPLPEAFHTLVEYAVLASPIDPFDPMDTAFKELGERCLAETGHLHSEWTLEREYPLSDDLLALSHVWRSPGGDRFAVAAKGAPEAVAQLCHLSSEESTEIERRVLEVAGRGHRVLGVARATFSAREGLPDEQHAFDFEFLGLVGLVDPVRELVPAAVRDAHEAGIRVVMITGDYPATAMSIAAEIGLDTVDCCITGPELAQMSDDELAERIGDVCIFARTVPEQKLRVVRAFQARGEVVAMTGDGVNDAPALKAADIGIAMGERGTDVAREASAMVLTDDDFTSIVGAVRQGRRVYDNLRKALAFSISVHVPIAGITLIPVLAGHTWPMVLMPVHIAFLELIIDPACSVVFEAEREEPGLMRRPPRAIDEPLFTPRVLTISLLQGMGVLLAVLAVYLGAKATGHSDADMRGLAFSTLVVANLGLILVNRSWTNSAWHELLTYPNTALRVVVGSAVVFLALVLSVPVLQQVFGFGTFQPIHAGAVLIAGAMGVAWFEIYKALSIRKPRVSGG
jgi:Ca2+-transporting ATPase